MRKTYDLTAIMDLEFDPAMVSYALEKETRDAAWEMWLRLYTAPQYGEDIPTFDAFYSKLTKEKPKTTEITYEQVEDEMMKIVRNHERQVRR